MNPSVQEKNKALSLRQSTPCSTNGTTQPLGAFGRPTTSSTAPISVQGVKGYSVWSRVCHRRQDEPGNDYCGRGVRDRSRAAFGSGEPITDLADIVRIADGVLAEHWDVIQDEATQQQSKSGIPMFGTSFPVEKSRQE